MPVNTPDQQLTMPILADAADNSVAFSDYNADSEPRLVHYYVDAADRTARNPTPPGGQISFLATPGRWDRFVPAPVSAWWESWPLYVNKAAEVQVVNASTAFVNDSHLLLPLQINARYLLEGLLIWDSGTTGDIKFDWTGPAGFLMPKWTISSVDVAVTTGIGNLNALGSVAAATPLARAGSAIGTFTYGLLSGIVTTVGTAGNLQLRWAQNASEAVNTRVKQDSYLTLTRVG